MAVLAHNAISKMPWTGENADKYAGLGDWILKDKGDQRFQSGRPYPVDTRPNLSKAGGK
jgi:hypothetical protein